MPTKNGMADTAAMAATAFDAACGHCLSKARLDFEKRYARYFSDETDESICHKARLVRDMQDKGMSFSEATDHPDVYLGSEDRDYVSYLLYHWQVDAPHRSLDEYRHTRLLGLAIVAVWRAINKGGKQ